MRKTALLLLPLAIAPAASLEVQRVTELFGSFRLVRPAGIAAPPLFVLLPGRRGSTPVEMRMDRAATRLLAAGLIAGPARP